MARGFEKAQKFHDENTGMGYTPFSLPKDKDTKQVRILQPETEWVNLQIHGVYQKVKETRCAATIVTEDNEEKEDRSTCPMCMADVPRKMSTYIPVRVRGDENSDRVQVIRYGRDGLAQVINQIENLPEGKNMTEFDFKITRKGEKLDTVYFWNSVADADLARPLNEAETALIVPNMEEIVPFVEEAQMLRRAQGHTDAESVAPVDAGAGTTTAAKKTPF